MRALVFEESLHVADDCSVPPPGAGEALVRVTLAGICNTDLEITRGYADFHGILGHEFVGVVESAPHKRILGRRVVGEINAACGRCAYCLARMPTHCANRTVLGIRSRPGAFADYLTLPESNLHLVPDDLPDEEAVFAEPLAAAVQVLENVHVSPTDDVIVLGDGKLGSLVAQVLRLTGCNLISVGKHERKLATLARLGIRTCLVNDLGRRRADVVVECTGQASGLELARTLVHPRGTIVLKSTFHGTPQVALTPYVVDEITIVGSRCGPFPPALRLMQYRLVQVRPLISATYSLAEGIEAMAYAATPEAMKVLLKP